MIQTFSILGFLLSLLALFFASEVLRRATQRQIELETALFKTNARLQTLESNVHHVEKLAAEVRYQRKRQAETITALANKGDAQHAAPLPPAPPHPDDVHATAAHAGKTTKNKKTG